jgi:predicted transcriptional regulator
MNFKVRNIEVKVETAELLEARAAARGVSVADVVAELVDLDEAVVEPNQLAELDRRWKSVEAGAKTVPHDEVVRWLETWGTAAYRPQRDR